MPLRSLIPCAPGALLRALLLSLLASAPALAQEDAPALDAQRAWTFQDLYELGSRRNSDLQQSHLAVEGLRWERLAAYGALLPKVNAGLDYGRGKQSKTTYEDPTGEVREQEELTSKATSSGLRLGLSQRLFAGFANTAALRRALLAQDEVTGADAQQQKQFRHDLRKAAHAVLAARGQLETERTLQEERGRQLDLAKVRLQVGKGTDLDVLQMEIDVGRQQVNVEAADRNLCSAWDKLALLLGAEPGPPGHLDMEFGVFEPVWREEDLLGQAQKNREDLASGRRATAQRHLETIEARAGFLPTLDLSLSHSRSEQRMGYEAWEPVPANYSNSVGLSLSLPVFQGFSTVNAWQGSRILERRQALIQEQLERQVRAEIREALASLKSAWAQSRYTESNLELSKRSLALERERYRLGLSSLLQVQSAEATWRQAENENLAQRLNFRDRLAELELAVGASLGTP